MRSSTVRWMWRNPPCARSSSHINPIIRFSKERQMAVNLHIPVEEAVFPVAGVEIGVTEAGIRKPGRRDLTVFRLAEGTTVAGVFTRNRFRAAPVLVCEENLALPGNAIRALMVNTGNAN